jgi:hypothetical protein
MQQRVELLRASGSHRGRVERPAAPTVLIRLCRTADDPALDRLAALEGAQVASGRFVVAEFAGTVIAALPIDGGATIADPFVRTAHLLPLLERRAAQVRQLECPRGRLSLRRLMQIG